MIYFFYKLYFSYEFQELICLVSNLFWKLKKIEMQLYKKIIYLNYTESLK